MPFGALAVIQARLNSQRLPRKVLSKINHKPLIQIQVERLAKSKYITELIVATTTSAVDDELCYFLTENNILFYRGSEEDVLSRFLILNEQNNFNYIARFTADCPLIMWDIFDSMFETFIKSNFDYISNSIPPFSFPDGVNVEIMRRETLIELSKFELSQLEKEHVTLGIYTRPNIFKIGNYQNTVDDSDIRLTVDFIEDLSYLRKLFQNSSLEETNVTYKQLMDFIRNNPQIYNEIDSNKRSLKTLGFNN
jgi:spore coat polysaccharide biosynthesis protein SpsF